MAWTTPRCWTTGEVVTAAIMNTHVKDNFNVTAPAVLTTAGDILYASGTNTPARVGKGTNGNILHQASCAPAWTASPSITGITLSGVLDANGSIDFDGTTLAACASGAITLTSTSSSANGVYLRANGGTSETVKIHSDQGTSVTEGAASVSLLSDAGGVELRSTANLANAVNITNDGGTTGTITIFNDQGTSVTEGAASIELLSDAGGVELRSTANLANAIALTSDGGTTGSILIFNDQGTTATEGSSSIQLLSDVGAVGIKSGLNGAGAIRLTADAGTSETIVIHADQGSGAASICLTSDAGGITMTASSAVTVTAPLTVGVDDTGHDVKFFGAGAGAYMEWDESANMLEVRGATAAGPGHLKLTTGEATVVACDVLGKIEFQAPAECGTDAITIAARIAAIAQGTFSATVNATDLVFYTGHSECAAEKIRFTSQGEIGIGGANYGTDGQVLTSAGAGAAVAWEDASAGATLSGSTDNTIVTVTGANAMQGEANLTFDGTNLTLGTGNVIIGTCGKGIDFSASSHSTVTGASMDSELLDDYEEGTWTPVIADAGNFSNTATMHGTIDYGQYTKIGNRVFVTVYVATTSVSGISAGLVIKGLPFPVKSGAQNYGSMDFGHGSGLSLCGEVPSGYFEPTTDAITLREWDGADGTTNLTAAEWSDDGSLLGMGHYIT